MERINAETIALLLNNHCVEHGIPGTLLSDHGSEFLNDIVLKLCEILDVKKINTPARYPQSDGQVRRWHQELKAGLRCIGKQRNIRFDKRDQARWDTFVPNIAASHNRKWSRRIEMSPDSAYFARDITTKLQRGFEEMKHQDSSKEGRKRVNDWIEKQQKLTVALAQSELDKYDQERKAYYDRLIKEKEFELNDKVLVYVGFIRGHGLENKLYSNWRGPFRIVKIFNDGYNFILSNGLMTNIHKIVKFVDRDAEIRVGLSSHYECRQVIGRRRER